MSDQWEGCEEVHLDCRIAQLEKEIARRDEYISKLEARIPKLNIDLAEASMHAYNGESARMKLEADLARRDEIIARLKEDAERLADGMIISPENEGDFCSYCGGMEHVDDCPITLHRALIAELEKETEK